MPEFNPKPPDYTVSALSKTNDKIKGVIGVGWTKPDGSITIKLNPFVVLDQFEHDPVITLFPITQQKSKGKPANAVTQDRPNEDIPF